MTLTPLHKANYIYLHQVGAMIKLQIRPLVTKLRIIKDEEKKLKIRHSRECVFDGIRLSREIRDKSMGIHARLSELRLLKVDLRRKYVALRKQLSDIDEQIVQHEENMDPDEEDDAFDEIKHALLRMTPQHQRGRFNGRIVIPETP